ncbi:MAG: plasmid mobilization relaxosome protein MobC [Eubacterium sp.]|nr:plasmid mobilization relaxosome protein MobC [Eubacterium sp.]
MQKTNRKRNISVTVRMNKSEYDDFINRVKETGLTKQAYIISSVRNATITPSEEIAVLKNISMTFSNLECQLRGLATNVNQMAHIANGQGLIPNKIELEKLSYQLSNYRKESESIWQSIRSLINQQKVTEP